MRLRLADKILCRPWRQGYWYRGTTFQRAASRARRARALLHRLHPLGARRFVEPCRGEGLHTIRRLTADEKAAIDPIGDWKTKMLATGDLRVVCETCGLEMTRNQYALDYIQRVDLDDLSE